jgi:hypothetical protein
VCDGPVFVCAPDHDDGSERYTDTDNLLLYGGAKNFYGNSKTSMRNIYLFPDAKLGDAEDYPYVGWAGQLDSESGTTTGFNITFLETILFCCGPSNMTLRSLPPIRPLGSSRLRA